MFKQQQISPQTFFLSVVSLCMSFSSGIFVSSMVVYSQAWNIKLEYIIFLRMFSESFGYIGKFTTGLLSDWFVNRRRFLLFGYGSVLIIKPLLLLCTFSFVALSWRITIFSIANIADKFFNTIRDGARDALILDYCSEENSSSNLAFRKSFSYLGTILGSLTSLFFLHKWANFRILYSISASIAFFGFFILYKFVHDSTEFQQKKNTIHSFFFNLLSFRVGLNKTLIFVLLLGTFILFLGKNNEFILSQEAFKKGFSPENSPLLSLCFYLFSFLMNIFMSFYGKNSFAIAFAALMFLSFNAILIFTKSLPLLIAAHGAYGMYNSILDNFVMTSVLRFFSQVPVKGFLIGIVNAVIGASYFANSFFFSKISPYGFSKILIFSSLTTSVALCLFLLIYKIKWYSNK